MAINNNPISHFERRGFSIQRGIFTIITVYCDDL